ncbi:hypothetical protein HYU06_02275 [Candidatus Woesearchaeota archaeon]|nr:hypothetical protein [Candidatus Woesearchaeota archaeon]
MKKVGVITYIMLFVLSIFVSFVFASCDQPSNPEVDNFAKCITEKGVTMYGVFWCPHCANQKKMFGSSFKLINYVECDPRCIKDENNKLPIYCNGMIGNPELCRQKNVKLYPHWEFSDGINEEGVMTFEDLAAKSGCSAPVKNKKN